MLPGKDRDGVGACSYLQTMTVTARRELVSPATRNAFRSPATDPTIRIVAELWEDHGCTEFGRAYAAACADTRFAVLPERATSLSVTPRKPPSSRSTTSPHPQRPDHGSRLRPGGERFLLVRPSGPPGRMRRHPTSVP
ncbi:hypothetical protein GCM10009760_61010 [Kitasatospora kazusensis]|uniref:Uncharacterized protein n=1 Tax=Kitasatospora kazusensis TaxID=407974 RepID=A0ABN3ABG4_9ACTN